MACRFWNKNQVNVADVPSFHTVMKNYRAERKGRRNFDTALEYDTARMMVGEKTRTTKAVARAC